jgi:putative SOS response-associated peptidase YedK
MCGRYANFLPAQAIARHGPPCRIRADLGPGAVGGRAGGLTSARHLDSLKWGLLPNWTNEPTKAKRPINA